MSLKSEFKINEWSAVFFKCNKRFFFVYTLTCVHGFILIYLLPYYSVLSSVLENSFNGGKFQLADQTRKINISTETTEINC